MIHYISMYVQIIWVIKDKYDLAYTIVKKVVNKTIIFVQININHQIIGQLCTHIINERKWYK